MNPPKIMSLATAVPDECYQQEDILALLLPYLDGNPRTEAIFRNIGIESRYLVVNGTYYERERTTQDRNDRYIETALPLGELAIQRCLKKAGLPAESVDDFIVVSCTGIDIPGLDLRLAGMVGMKPWLRRTCVLGMGCYGAFPGLLRAREAAIARPGSTALVLAVEICSLHFQPGDSSMENVVSSALFADGAAAALVSNNPDARGPVLVDSATYCDYQTFDHMAFHLTDHGFRMSLSSYVPKLLAAKVEEFVDELLSRNGLSRGEVVHWGVHPGSRKILEHVEQRLSLPTDALEPSRTVLSMYGNMSSATILFVIDEIERQRHPRPGEYGVLMSFGPGLTMEGALLRW